MTPPTFKKPPIIREIDALRVKPDEVLVLRFSEAISTEEIELLDGVLQQGPLKGRVILLKVPVGEGEPTIVEAEK